MAHAIDLLAAGALAPLPRAFLEGRDRALLEPLRLQRPEDPLPGEPPAGSPDRSALAAALAVANRGWGHPQADALAAKLADPATRVVVTGQQPGLLGGPLLSLVKALAAVHWAERLEADGRGPAVAVFWVATEDHDWTELSRATVIGRDGARELDLGEDPSPLAPVGMRTFGAALEGVLEALEELGPGELGRERLAPLRAAYRPNARFGEAFARLHAALLGERAPLYLDAMLPELKTASRPFLRSLVERRREVAAELEAAHRRVEAAGYALQVTPQPGASPLFLLRGGERRRVVWEGEDRYVLRGADEEPRPVAELLETIAENPGVVSAGVLARPAVQDGVLGTTLQVMGPAEVSYLAQAVGVYRALGVPGPRTALRPRALVLEARHLEHLDELGAPLADVLAAEVDTVIHDRLGSDLLGPARERIEAAFEALRPGVEALDRGLASPLEKTREHALRGLEKLEGKIRAAEGRRHATWRSRLEAVRDLARPGGVDQERSVAVASFLARYGPGFVAAIDRGLDLDPRQVRPTVLDPSGVPPEPPDPATRPDPAEASEATDEATA